MCELLGGTLTGGGTMQSFPQDRMAAVNNYLAIILDPALFRTDNGERVAEACRKVVDVNDEARDLRAVPTPVLEAELAARRREQQGPNDTAAQAAARAAFQQEAKVLADWYASEPCY